MNTYELLKFGELVRRTSARHKIMKVAQASHWLYPVIGGLGGFVAGKKLYDDTVRGTSSDTAFRRVTVPILGGLGGAFLGSSFGPQSYNFYRNLYNLSSYKNAIPIAGALSGGYIGYTLPSYLPGGWNKDSDTSNWSNSSRILSALVGAGIGTTAGLGFLNFAKTRGLSGMREYILNRHGDDAIEELTSMMRQSRHSGIQDILKNDPNKAVQVDALTKALQRLHVDELDSLAAASGPAASSYLARASVPTAHGIAGARPDWDYISQLGYNLGIYQPSQMGFVNRTLSNMFGPDYMQNYVKPAVMLGGAYVGANALMNLYNKYQMPQYQNNNANRRQVIIT